MMNPQTELRATRQMFELATETFEFVLSDSAKSFIKNNNLGPFSLRFDGDEQWLIITAPDEFAATMFRLAL